MENQISHFRVLEEIGSGGMGVVYRARDQRLRRKVALKVLPAGVLADSMIRERLMREAQTTSALNHPHIVTVFDIHSAGDRDFIAMEYVEGQSLDHVIGEDGLPLDKALRYALQIADGLACAHEHGVIHRDLKPQNIMITPSDDVKILDFGLAKRFLPAARAGETSIDPGLRTLTAPGVKVGTPAFMSPEQIESRPIDARSDVFSYGCLLYQMLTGVNPFQRRNAILIFKAVLSDQPESLRAIKPGLPVELERILNRALEKAPDARYQNMRELLTELELVHAELFGPTAQVTQPAVPAREWLGRGAVWLPSLLALPIAAAALVWWLNSRSQSPRLEGHRPFSSALSSGRDASFSPAGDRIVFVEEDASGSSYLGMRSLAGGPATRIESVDGAIAQPGWSSQAGGTIIFGKRGGGVWAVDLEPVESSRLVLERATTPRLSPDGRRLSVELDGQVWTVATTGDDASPVASIPPAFFSRWVARSPALSPDGRRIAYFQPTSGSFGDLWVAPAGPGEPRRLLGDTLRAGDPVWTTDGQWVVFWAEIAGEINLWCVPASGGKPRQLTHGAGRHTAPAVSADGRRLAYTASRESFAIERRDALDDESRRLMTSHQEIVRPSVSPSGDRVAFHAPDGPDVHLFVMQTDSGEVTQVTADAGERNFLPRWSADGAHLYYYQEHPVLSLRKTRLPSAGRQRASSDAELLGDWSRHTHYDSAVDAGEQRVVYTPIEAGEPQRLRVRELEGTREHELGATLLDVTWSADGTEVLGANVEDRIYLCPAVGGDCRFLAEGFAPSWSSPATITFARRVEATPRDRVQTLSIWTLAIDSLEGHEIAEIEAAGTVSFSYGFLAGGDLVWNRVVPGHQEIWIADLR